MVARQSVPGQRRQRQQAVCVEPVQPGAHADLHGPPGGGEGHRLVAAPPRAAG